MTYQVTENLALLGEFGLYHAAGDNESPTGTAGKTVYTFRVDYTF